MAILRRAGPELCGIRAVVSPVGVDTPLVWSGRAAVNIVLVKGKQIRVLQDVDVILGQQTDVGSDEEGRFHGGPQSKVCARLGCRQVAVANLEHVGVIMPPEANGIQLERVQVQDVSDRVPFGRNIAAHAPADAGCVAPREDIGRAPDAQAEDNFIGLVGQGVSHLVKPLSRFRGAPVISWRSKVGIKSRGASAIWAGCDGVWVAGNILILPI